MLYGRGLFLATVPRARPSFAELTAARERGLWSAGLQSPLPPPPCPRLRPRLVSLLPATSRGQACLAVLGLQLCKALRCLSLASVKQIPAQSCRGFILVAQLLPAGVGSFFWGGGGNDWDLPLGGKSRILVVFRFSVVLFVCFLFLKAEAPCAVQAGFKLTVAC